MEQMTYLFFIKLLDDSQIKKEANAQMFGVAVKDPVFKEGNWVNPDTGQEVPYAHLSWSVFKNFDTTPPPCSAPCATMSVVPMALGRMMKHRCLPGIKIPGYNVVHAYGILWYDETP